MILCRVHPPPESVSGDKLGRFLRRSAGLTSSSSRLSSVSARWQFYSVDRARDFLDDDVFYPDAAQSIIQHGFYGINGYPETNMPPGVSWIVALLCMAGSCTHVVFLRTMVVLATLGFLGSYELLRRQVPRAVAAAICLL